MVYAHAFDEGRTFDEFLAHARSNRDLWLSIAQRARIAPQALEDAARLPGSWRLLGLADDWCGDAVNILPVVARMAASLDNLQLRIVGRDEHPGLMERHLTNGSRSIPVFILLDESDSPRGWWGPRPAALQAWFETLGRALPQEERYRELRRWYARDRGATIVREVTDLMVCGAAVNDGFRGGTRPCPELLAA